MVLAPCASGLALVDVDAGASVSGAISESAVYLIAGASRIIEQRPFGTLPGDASKRPLRVGASERGPAIVRTIFALVIIDAPLRVSVQRVSGAAGVFPHAAKSAARVLASLALQTSSGHELTLVDVLALLRRCVALEPSRTRRPKIPAAPISPEGPRLPAAAGSARHTATRARRSTAAAASGGPQNALVSAARVDAFQFCAARVTLLLTLVHV